MQQRYLDAASCFNAVLGYISRYSAIVMYPRDPTSDQYSLSEKEFHSALIASSSQKVALQIRLRMQRIKGLKPRQA